MSKSIYLLTIGLPLGTILLIFAMRYFSAVQQARARLANDNAYRQLAERSTAAQAETAAALSAIGAALAELKGRVATLEKILKEVE
jgi:Na+-transporting methylmalonyl-CoA/oxaloacetate decarboxylase gamma subunit